MNHQLFLRELEQGLKYEKFVTDFLQQLGIECHMQASIEETMRVSRNLAADNRRRFTENQKDIIVDGVGVLEVKSRNLSFSPEPLTYPFETAFVDTVSGWQAKSVKPIAVVLVSRATNSMLAVSPKTEHLWDTVSTFDRTRQINDKWFVCPKTSLYSMGELVSVLRRRQKND